MAIWVCSDLHFGHDKEFIWKNRGFNSIEEHDAAIIQRHNELVKPEDIVYCLGDLFLGNNNEAGLAHLQEMNGHFFVAIGNHDSDTRVKQLKQLMEAPDNGHFHLENAQFMYRLRYKKHNFILSHYPVITENGGGPHLIWNLHGHTHFSKAVDESRLLCYDVSPEAHDCRPLLLDDIIEALKEQKRMYREIYPLEVWQ